MSSHTVASLIELQESPCIRKPDAALHRDEHGLNCKDCVCGGRQFRGEPIHVKPQTPPNDLETSNPPSPTANGAVEITQNLSSSPKNKWRLLNSCLMSLGRGLNDSAPGALIPYMEKQYNIGYAIVSLIFVTNAVGFISAAPCTDFLETRFGRSRTYILSLLPVLIAHAVIICGPPFPVVVTCFFFIGFGQAIGLALDNVFCANLANNAVPLGFLHGAYGIGGTVAPLAATAIASNGVKWSFFFSITSAILVYNIAASWWVWRGYEKEVPVEQSTLQQTVSRQAEGGNEEVTKSALLRQAIKHRVTLLGALFIFAYQGAEVSISGWVVSFLVGHRGADVAKVGYVTTGFWGGITVGRFLLSQPAHKLGRKLSVIVLVVGSAAFQILLWWVPNIVGDAVALAVVGLLLGPIYPCAASVFTALLPRNIQLSSMGFISAMGSSGGAVAPFFTGLLAQKLGTMVLHPICIGLYAVMLASWAWIPRIRKRSE